jgi:ribosomal protein S18 acetylase RimI-like enzyme
MECGRSVKLLLSTIGDRLETEHIRKPMKISTRTARADDKPAMWRLYESEMKQHIEAIWGWDAAWQITDFDKAFAASSTCIVEVDGRFSGYVQLDLGTVENYLRMIVLLPECRSLGIGARLLAEILRVSRHAGRNLYLRVFRTNVTAKRFYEREGWLVAADEGDFFLMRHETRLPEALV